MTSGLLILLHQNVMNGFTAVFSEFSKSCVVYNHCVKQTSSQGQNSSYVLKHGQRLMMG